MHAYLRRNLNSQKTRGEPGIEPMHGLLNLVYSQPQVLDYIPNIILCLSWSLRQRNRQYTAVGFYMHVHRYQV